MRAHEIRARALSEAARLITTLVSANVAANRGGKTNITTTEVLKFAEEFEAYIRGEK